MGKLRPEAQRIRLQTAEHAPARFRVLGPLFNTPEFFYAFDVSAEQRNNRLNPKPLRIW